MLKYNMITILILHWFLSVNKIFSDYFVSLYNLLKILQTIIFNIILTEYYV